MRKIRITTASLGMSVCCLLLSGCWINASHKIPTNSAQALSQSLPPLTCQSPQIPDQGAVACVLPPPTVTPADNQAIVFYQRPDGDYEGWVLHAWNDVNCPASVQQPTGGPQGVNIHGVDPVYGGYYTIPLQQNHADCLNFSIRHTNGIGDISQRDLLMDLTAEPMAWTISGVEGVFSEPHTEMAAEITGAAAHWVTADTLVWQIPGVIADPKSVSVRLYHAADATLAVTAGEIHGGDFIPLTAGAEADDGAAVLIRQPNWSSYHLDSSAVDLQQLIRGQLVAAAVTSEGKLLAATRVQLPRLLDALFTQGEDDADEQALGLSYRDEDIRVAVWAPTAQAMALQTLRADKTVIATTAMTYDSATGIWSSTVSRDLDRLFYRFTATVYHPLSDTIETLVTTDPYSVSLSTNGQHSQFVDLTDADLMPAGWKSHRIPTLAHPTDAVIYEGHIRDFSVLDASVAPQHRGKYLAFTDPSSVPMQHLQRLVDAGLTHFHLLPANDIATIPEDTAQRVDVDATVADLCAINSGAKVCSESASTTPEMVLSELFASFDPSTGDAQQLAEDMRHSDSFNWGYDPQHFNVPDGSYATDPEGVRRITEMRAMIQGLHEIGLRVALDVVYNHTSGSGLSADAVMDKLVPGYYHRYHPVTGAIERSTCCENTATEHRMMEKFTIDSLLLWTEHYQLDAFRFDLMGHMPKSTILKARQAVQAIDPDNYFYGEGWDFGEVAGNRLFEQATQKNMAATAVGTFNDQLREAVRGAALFTGEAHTSGTANTSSKAQTDTFTAQDKLRMGLAGTLGDYQLHNAAGAFISSSSLGGYGAVPADIINYVSKHDNETLWDQLNYTLPGDLSRSDRVRAQNLSMAIPLLSQGIPFLQIGGDFLRSKSMDRNSYDGGDWFNRVDFSLQSHNWNIGLPSVRENAAKYQQITALLADPKRQPSAKDVQFAAAVFREFLQIRTSSPLFRLRDLAAVQQRVGFHNTGPQQRQGLLVMSIDDGSGVTDVDQHYDAIVVLLNGTPASITHTIATAIGFQLHPVQRQSIDPQLATAGFEANADAGSFTVPAYSVAVFVKPQQGDQGAGLSPYASTGTPGNSALGQH